MLLYNESQILFSLEKKILNKNLYFKYYVRSFLKMENAQESIFTIIDNNSNFYNTNLNLKYFKHNLLKKKHQQLDIHSV